MFENYEYNEAIVLKQKETVLTRKQKGHLGLKAADFAMDEASTTEGLRQSIKL
jgi:hypothetical protein